MMVMIKIMVMRLSLAMWNLAVSLRMVVQVTVEVFVTSIIHLFYTLFTENS